MTKRIKAALIITSCIIISIVLIFKAAGPRKTSPVKGEAAMPRLETKAQDEISGLIAKEDYPKAIKLLNDIMEKYPLSSREEQALYTLASIYDTRGELLRERDVYKNILEKFPASDFAAKARARLDEANIKILFSPTPDPDSFTHEIGRGDTLSKIAKKSNTTVDLLMKTNNLKDGAIKAGRKLKVTKLKFSISVDKSQNILTLKGDDRILKTYQVATGINNCTPVGSFKIINKVVDPVWYTQQAVVPAGSPKNILGSRWMGISVPGYGIHGCTDPSSIGKQATAGCIRMHNSDVEELYAIVPVGTEIIVED